MSERPKSSEFTPREEKFPGRNPGLNADFAFLMSKAPVAYCDYLAFRIKGALSCFDPERIIAGVGPVKSDLHSGGGYLMTTAKTVEVTDRNGVRYRVTVEEYPHTNPCRLPPSDCEICQDREWNAAHAEGA